MVNNLTPSIAEHNSIIQLADDIQQILTEHEFTSRWVLIEGYHKIGHKLQDVPGHSVTELSEMLGRPARHLNRCKQFYRKYPDINELPEGKTISWHKIVNKYLPDTKKETKPKMMECPYCHKQWEK